jgi:hypothetical protein
MDHPIKLNAKVAALAGVVSSGEAAPTLQARQVFDDLSARVATELQRLREVMDTDVTAFNALIREASVPAIVPTAPSKEPAKVLATAAPAPLVGQAPGDAASGGGIGPIDPAGGADDRSHRGQGE